MKKTQQLFIFFLMSVINCFAQNPVDCKYNFTEAILYLRGSDNIKPDTLKAIDYLKPCIENKDSNSMLLMSRILFKINDSEKYKEPFKLTKKSAKLGNSIAAHDLGVLFKYGKGTNRNLKKAIKWFKKSHYLKNTKASYSIGYMYFKGFGNLDQNYKKAVKWFKKSDYPMAKHWLAICYYFGYGIEQDKDKAIKILKNNKIDNSTFLANNLEIISNKKNTLKEYEKEALLKLMSKNNNIIEEDFLKEIKGNWIGSLLQLDWSSKDVIRKTPLEINFFLDTTSNENKYIVKYDEDLQKGIMDNNGDLSFQDLTLKLNHIYPINESSKKINYSIESIEAMTSYTETKKYLFLLLETKIEKWKESGAPIFLVLEKEIDKKNTRKLSNEAIESLNSQKENFIKVFPNPVSDNLIISYELKESSEISGKIVSMDGLMKINFIENKLQKKGDYKYFLNINNLDKGIYIIKITYGNKTETKMIIKN